jgi:hypothetical protein
MLQFVQEAPGYLSVHVWLKASWVNQGGTVRTGSLVLFIERNLHQGRPQNVGSVLSDKGMTTRHAGVCFRLNACSWNLLRLTAADKKEIICPLCNVYVFSCISFWFYFYFLHIFMLNWMIIFLNILIFYHNLCLLSLYICNKISVTHVIYNNVDWQNYQHPLAITLRVIPTIINCIILGKTFCLHLQWDFFNDLLYLDIYMVSLNDSHLSFRFFL